ncbi:hypothetical protein ABPG75_002574 [Micractinium tetrahymenae]
MAQVARDASAPPLPPARSSQRAAPAAADGAVFEQLHFLSPLLVAANGLHLRLQMGIVDRDEHTLEIVAASAVPAGAEVHNTYGELGNAELVKKYGFALRQNPFTAVGLDKRRLLAAAAAALGPRRWKARSRLLRDQTEVLEEDEEPFEALPNGHVSPALYVALRVLGATDAELASWHGISDALRLPPAAAAGGRGSSSIQRGVEEREGEDGGKDNAEEEEGEEEGEPQLGAVQVWWVLDTAGQPLPEAEVAATAEEAVPEGAAAGGSQGYAELLPASMWQLLAEEVRQRQAAYAAPLEADLQQLAELERQQAEEQARHGAQQAQQAEQSSSEAQQAEHAALLLRITEKEVLRDLLTALQRRLAAMGAGEAEAADGAARQGEGAAAGQGKGSARGKQAAAAGERKGTSAANGAAAARKRKQR